MPQVIRLASLLVIVTACGSAFEANASSSDASADAHEELAQAGDDSPSPLADSGDAGEAFDAISAKDSPTPDAPTFDADRTDVGTKDAGDESILTSICPENSSICPKLIATGGGPAPNDAGQCPPGECWADWVNPISCQNMGSTVVYPAGNYGCL